MYKELICTRHLSKSFKKLLHNYFCLKCISALTDNLWQYLGNVQEVHEAEESW